MRYEAPLACLHLAEATAVVDLTIRGLETDAETCREQDTSESWYRRRSFVCAPASFFHGMPHKRLLIRNPH